MRPVGATSQGGEPLWNPGGGVVDAVIKFRTTASEKAALEQVADSRGVSVSRLLRQAANVAKRGLLVDDAVLHDLRTMRELANSVLVAINDQVPADVAAKLRAATTGIHDLANRHLRGAL